MTTNFLRTFRNRWRNIRLKNWNISFVSGPWLSRTKLKKNSPNTWLIAYFFSILTRLSLFFIYDQMFPYVSIDVKIPRITLINIHFFFAKTKRKSSEQPMRLPHLIVLLVGFFSQESRFFQLIFKSVHTFLICQAPVFQNLSLPEKNISKVLVHVKKLWITADAADDDWSPETNQEH